MYIKNYHVGKVTCHFEDDIMVALYVYVLDVYFLWYIRDRLCTYLYTYTWCVESASI